MSFLKKIAFFMVIFLIINYIDSKASKRYFIGQLLNPATFFLTAPLNVATYLGTPQWLDKELYENEGIITKPKKKHFASIEKLRHSIAILKKEALKCIEKSKPINKDFYFEGIADEGWRRFYIKWYGPSDSLAKQICPETCKLLDDMPEVHLAMFSILMPHTKIKPHNGPARMCLRYHMGLYTPNDNECFISLNGKKYSWRDSEDVIFDDTLQHYVENNTDKPRIILFLDIERPQSHSIFNKIRDFQIKNIAPITTRSNEKQEITVL